MLYLESSRAFLCDPCLHSLRRSTPGSTSPISLSLSHFVILYFRVQTVYQTLCVCARMRVLDHLCVHTGRQEVNFEDLSLISIHRVFWDKVSDYIWTSLFLWDSVVIKCMGSTWSLSPSQHWSYRYTVSQLLHGFCRSQCRSLSLCYKCFSHWTVSPA